MRDADKAVTSDALMHACRLFVCACLHACEHQLANPSLRILFVDGGAVCVVCSHFHAPAGVVLRGHQRPWLQLRQHCAAARTMDPWTLSRQWPIEHQARPHLCKLGRNGIKRDQNDAGLLEPLKQIITVVLF